MPILSHALRMKDRSDRQESGVEELSQDSAGNELADADCEHEERNRAICVVEVLKSDGNYKGICNDRRN